MAIQRTTLTPELATQLLAKQHPRQRRPAIQTVALYAREMRAGKWRSEVPDPILIDPDGFMFNGSHRCAAVVESGVSIEVEIRYGADASLFDVIDVGRKRSAYQFIPEANAGNRAAAARVMLWYRRRFDHALSGVAGVGYFDMSEILAESDRAADGLAEAMPIARIIYEFTNIPISLAAAVFALAAEEGILWEQITDFRDGIVGMANLPEDDARRALAERMRQKRHRDRRRKQSEDWTVLVRALNAFLHGDALTRLDVTQVLPRIGETEATFKRRRDAIKQAELRHRNDQSGDANRARKAGAA
jgi:hypothetical protein